MPAGSGFSPGEIDERRVDERGDRGRVTSGINYA